MTTTARTADLVSYVLDEADHIEFLDHSPTGGQWATLTDMRQPARAGNNCWAATHALIEHLIEQIGLDPDQDIAAVELTYSAGVHWAPVLRYATGEQVILDFTARQFDPATTFPLTASLEDWKQQVDTWVHDLHGETTSDLRIA